MSEHDPNQGTDAPADAAPEPANARTAQFFRRGTELAKPMVDLSSRNMEAFAVSAKVAGRAVESLTQEVTEYGRKTFDNAFAMMRSFAEVRSPTDLLRVQGEFAKAAFDNAIAFSNNVSDRLTKTAGEVEPSKPTCSAAQSGSDQP